MREREETGWGKRKGDKGRKDGEKEGWGKPYLSVTCCGRFVFDTVKSFEAGWTCRLDWIGLEAVACRVRRADYCSGWPGQKKHAESAEPLAKSQAGYRMK